jgi:hypothetical protein
MNASHVFTAIVAVAFLNGLTCSGQDLPFPQPVIVVDYEKWDPKGPNEVIAPSIGQLVQLSLIRSTFEKTEMTLSLNLDIQGDALAKVAQTRIGAIPWGKGTGMIFGDSGKKRHVAWMFRAAKEGTATIKITPVEDGLQGETRGWKVRVGPAKGKPEGNEPKSKEEEKSKVKTEGNSPKPAQGVDDPKDKKKAAKKNYRVLPPYRMIQIDYNLWDRQELPWIPPKKYIYVPKLDTLVQFSIDRGSEKKQIRTLKIEIVGDALGKVGLIEFAVIQPDGVPKSDPYKIAWLLIAQKKGYATVKITPIGVDGIERPSKEWKLDINGVTPPVKNGGPGQQSGVSIFHPVNLQASGRRFLPSQ